MENKNQVISPQPDSAATGVVNNGFSPEPSSGGTGQQTQQAQSAQASDSRYYPIENLETPSTTNLDQPNNQTTNATQPSQNQFASQFSSNGENRGGRRNKVIIAIVVAAALITGLLGWLWIRQNQQGQKSLTEEIPEQTVELTGLNSGLAGLAVNSATSQVLVNGNIVTTGSLYVADASSGFFGQLSVDTLSDNQNYTLPNESGTVCLDTNNCNFAVAADIDNPVSTTINSLAGAITLQGTSGQVSVSSSGSTITLSLPTSVITVSSDGFLQGGNSYGAAAILGTNDNYSLSFETNGITRASINTSGQLNIVSGDIVAPSTLNLYSDGYSDPALTLFDVGSYRIAKFKDSHIFLGEGSFLIESSLDITQTISSTTCPFGCWGINNLPTVSHTTTVSNFGGIRTGYTTAASSFTLLNGFGLYAGGGSAGAGSTITNNYGVFVADQTAGTNDYGVTIAGADTQALWIGSGANNTDAANGIAFGSSRDTNLYRGASNKLKTDDDLLIQTTTDSTTALVVADADGGTPVLSVDTVSERVGVGTGSPATVLHVAGTALDSGGGGGSTAFVEATLDSASNNQQGLHVQSTVTPSGASTAAYTGIISRTISSSTNLSGGAIVALGGQAENQGTGTIGTVIGITSLVENDSTGTITNAFSAYIQDASNPSGTITNNYGILVNDQTAGTNDYGIAIAGADTQALWIGSGADNTDTANGIAFGSSRDTNLYRSASGRLKTDADYEIGDDLYFSEGGSHTILVNSSTSGDGGSLTIGSGAAAFASGNGGDLTIQAGEANSSGGGIGGDLNLYSGGAFLGTPGDINIEAGGNNLSPTTLGNINIGTVSGTSTINIGTGTGSNIKTVTLGSTTSSSYTSIKAGTGGLSLESAASTGTYIYSDRFEVSPWSSGFGTLVLEAGANNSYYSSQYPLWFFPTSSSTIPLIIEAASGQTADLFQVRSSSNAVLAGFSASGALVFGSTADTNLYRSTTDTLKTDDSLVVAGTGTVGGASNSLQLTVKGNASQSANLQEWQNSGGTAQASIAANGKLTINGTADTTNGRSIQIGTTFDSTSSGQTGVYSNPTVSPGSASNQTYNGVVGIPSSSSANLTAGTLVGVSGVPTYSGTGTVSELIGVNGRVTNSSTGTITSAYSLLANTSTNNGTITNNYGVLIKSASGTITANYGIQVKAQTAGTSDYGISIEAADTQTLWIASNDASATSAAKGIAFGSASDVNLYRGGSNILQTDDSLLIGTNLGVNNSTAPNRVSINSLTTADADAEVAVGTGATDGVGIVVQAVAGQTANLQEWQDSTGASLAYISSIGDLYVQSAVVDGDLTVNGHITGLNQSGTTTVAAGAGAGSGASATIAGSDVAGYVSVTTGSGAGSGALATITFSTSYSSASYGPSIVLTPKNGNGTTIQYFAATSSTSTFTIDANDTPADSTTYEYYYHVIQFDNSD